LNVIKPIGINRRRFRLNLQLG